jgi:hypothetical protein
MLMAEQRAKTSGTGKRAVQLAGSAAKGSLDLDLALLSWPWRCPGMGSAPNNHQLDAEHPGTSFAEVNLLEESQREQSPFR